MTKKLQQITISLSDLSKIVEEQVNRIARANKAIKAQKHPTTDRKEIKKAKEEFSGRHLKLLEEILTAPNPIKAEELPRLAIKVGYDRGQGPAAAFRGKHPSIQYRVERYLEVTKWGKELLLRARQGEDEVEEAKPRKIEEARPTA